MRLNSYLTFDGRCEAAFKFYAKVLGGKIEAAVRIDTTRGEPLPHALAAPSGPQISSHAPSQG